MKKEASKKSKLWIWLAAGIVLLLALVGVVLALVLGGGQKADEGPKGGRADLYWNIDKAFYTKDSLSGLSTREPGENGIYRVRYAYNGEQVELPVADKQLINYIDTLDCMGIVQDADGTVIDVIDPKTLATETARSFYVRKVENGVITLNSSMAMNGMSMDISVKEVTEIYNVVENAEVIGQIIQPDSLLPMDAVTVYSNDLGEATHIYLVSHPVESPVYWRADTGTYSSTTKSTTRVPDAEGYYTIPFYVNGEYVELKCNDVSIVNTIDAKNRFKAHTGLVLDENGCIVDNMLAAAGIRGLLGCDMYDIISVNGKSFTAEALIAGSGDTYSNTLTDDAVIYDVSLAAKPEVRGKATDSLKIGDRVAVFENAEGEAVLVFVAHRLVDSPMYFNVTKKYNSTEKTTTRTPDAAGWYYIDLMCDGEIKTYKTKDKALVDKIDSQNNRCVGLQLSGDIIEYVWEGECVAGNSAYVGYTVKTVAGSIISAYPLSGEENIKNMLLRPDCKVYNMSGVKQEKGELTTLQPNDYCIMWRNARSEIVYVYVIRRHVDAPVYFSLTRKWDATIQQTTRVPDADGWYIYECASEGKLVTVKTRDKKIANFLDSQSPQSFGLEVGSGGVIIEAYETTNVTGGSKAYLNTLVKRTDVLTLYSPTAEKVYTPKLAEGCEIYNMSGVFEKHKGEKTTLQINDSIQCYTNVKGEIALIFVRIRKVDADVYFSKSRVRETTEDGKTARQPDADGWYVFECALDGKEVTVKTKDIDVATMMDAQSPQAFALKVDKNGVIQKAYPATAATGGSTRALNAVVKSVDGDRIVVRLTSGEDFEMPVASKYAVYNVSSVYDDHWGEATKIKVGDTLQSYTNSSNKVCLIYVRTREANVRVYWNVDRQYDSVNKVSTRTPGADGYYHIDLAVDGAIKSFRVKDAEVMNAIEKQSGAVACWLEGDVITKAMSAIYAKGVWTSVDAAHIGTVQAIAGNTVSITKTGVEEPLVFDMAADIACYDVSGNGDFIGQATDLKVGDYVRSYLNVDKKLLYVYVIRRGGGSGTENTEQLKLYWNVNRMKGTDGSSREAAADGYYYIDLAVDGEIKTFKTNQKSIVDYIDYSNNGATALTVEGDAITACASALAGEGVAKAGTTGTVKAIDGNQVTHTTDSTFTLAANAAIYDVSGKGDFIGQATELKVGDNYRSYVNADGQILYAYILSREAVEEETVYNNDKLTFTDGSKAECTYCGEVVEWTALEAVTDTYITLTDGGHYYLADSLTSNASYYNIAANTTACVHLNDNDVTSANRVFAVGSDATLSIMGNGTVTGSNTATATANVAGATISCRGNLNLIGGTYKHTNSTLPTIIMTRPQKTVSMYEGVTIEGTEGVTGSNLFIAYGIFNMYGGTITGGTAVEGDTTGGKGGNLCVLGTDLAGTVKARAEANIMGGTIDGGIYASKNTESFKFSVSGDAVITDNDGGLTLASDTGAVLTLGELGQNAQICVTAEGTVTAASENAAAYVNTKILPASGNITLTAENDVILAAVGTEEEPPAEPVDMNAVKAAADEMASIFAEANGAAVEAQCPACGKTVTWNAMPAISGATVVASGHYYATNVEIAGGYYNINNGVEVCVHLNGATLTNTGERIFYVDKGSKLTVMGTGKLTGGRKASTSATVFRNGSALEVVGVDSVVNLCGGTWSKSRDDLDVVGVRARGDNGALNIYDGTVINIGQVQGNALWAAGGKVNLHGGEINGDILVKKYAVDSATIAYAVDLQLAGTAVNGKVHYNTDNGTEIQTTVLGDAVVAELIPDAQLPIQIGRMLPGADVKVTADGVFTAENANAQDYVDDGFISAKADGKTLTVTDGVISCVDVAAAYDNSSLTFTEGTNAECTYCGKTVEWTALEAVTGTSSITLTDGGHYYLADDLLDNTLYYGIGSNETVCVHLNGHNVTSKSRVFAVSSDGTLTIMGNGTVTGSNTATATANVAGATISCRGSLNLIGGTYKHTNSTLPTIIMTRPQKTVNMYEGVTIEGTEGVTGSNLFIAYGIFNMYGGTITGGTAVEGDTTGGKGGNLCVLGTDLAGTVKARAEANIYGGTIDGGVYAYKRTNSFAFRLQGDPVIANKDGGITLDNGALITLGRLTKGAEVYITAADGTFTAENARAAAFLDYGYLKAAVEGKTITEENGVLSIG